MPCPDMVERICAELGENIDSEVCTEIRQHLATCPDCSAYVDSLKKTVYLYRQLPENSLPEDIQNRLHAVLNLNR